MKKIILPIVVLLVAANNNIIEYLSGENYPSSIIMIFRGFIALTLTLLIALILKQKIIPQNPKSQIFRFFIEGASIWLLYESFKYLSAGSVALMQRMDIPFLVIISFFRGKSKSSLQFYLSIWAIFILLFFVLDAKLIDEEPIGFAYALASVFLLAVTFFIIKGQTSSESIYTISSTYAISLIVIGTIVGLIKQDNFTIQTKHLWLFGFTGIFQVFIVLAGVALFKYYTPEKARLPFILGAFATLILEMTIEQKLFSFNQIGLSILITGIIATICLDPKTPKISKSLNTTEEGLPPT